LEAKETKKEERKEEMKRHLVWLLPLLLLTACVNRHLALTPEQELYITARDIIVNTNIAYEESMMALGQLHEQGAISDEELELGRQVGQRVELGLKALRSAAAVYLESGTDKAAVFLAIAEVTEAVSALLELSRQHDLAKLGGNLS
jgi:hypothetical protein